VGDPGPSSEREVANRLGRVVLIVLVVSLIVVTILIVRYH
jgi:hypothetical protein